MFKSMLTGRLPLWPRERGTMTAEETAVHRLSDKLTRGHDAVRTHAA